MKHFKALPLYIKIIMIILLAIITIGIVYLLMPTNIAVLGYHDFTNDISSNDMQMESTKFDKEMKYLSDYKYKSLKLDDLRCYLKHTCKLSKKTVLITLDDGWKSSLTIAAPILKKYNLNAVIFYMGVNYDGSNSNFMDKNDLEILRQDYPNIEIASHSYDLHHDNDYLKSEAEISADFKKMNSIIQTKYFAYPYGLKSDAYESVLKDNNYELAFTFGPNKEHRKVTEYDNIYEVPRLNISNKMSFNKFKLRLLWPF